MKTGFFLVFLSSVFIFFSPQSHSLAMQKNTSNIISKLQQAYKNKGIKYHPHTKHLNKDGSPKFINHLIFQNSPYLIQHAHNPVNWYSWGDEAFDKAKKENKLIFLSIGYATCHWCHVMEKESFEDLEVADSLNKNYISIKVDRELNPDIDAKFMDVVRVIGGSGGWPLSAILAPNGDAFFAATYFPKKQFLFMLEQINAIWKKGDGRVKKQTEAIKFSLQSIHNKKQNNTQLDTKYLRNRFASQAKNRFDGFYGGFSNAPKFPSETILLNLISQQTTHPNNATLQMINITLTHMASGGIYDVLGGGFHRYSTDNSWLTPHFEKMLYNQAQISLVYTRAYKLTKNPLYKYIAKKTIDYTIKKLHSRSGGFYGATDADSGGMEGGYFLWDLKQISDSLTKEEFKKAKQVFSITKNGNFEGKNIIRFKNIEKSKPYEDKEVINIIDKLEKIRAVRKSPFLDSKILLSWNSLFIMSLLEFGEISNDTSYKKLAIDTANFLYKSLYKKNTLYKAIIEKKLATTEAIFEDYSYFIYACLSIYDSLEEKSLAKKWLDRAEDLTKKMIAKFWDEKNFGFFLTDNKMVNIGIKDGYDNAIPATNAIAYKTLLMLESRTQNSSYYQKISSDLLASFGEEINNATLGYGSFLLAMNEKETNSKTPVYIYEGRIKISYKKHKTNLEILLNIENGWHINTNNPKQTYLKPTIIEISKKHDINEDIKITSLHFPKGKNRTFGKENLEVYENNTTIKVALNKEILKPLELEIQLQACSDKNCLPPEKITFIVY